MTDSRLSAAIHVFDAIWTRRSVRAFTADPVPRSTVEAILSLASRAPSGSNIQPWKVHVLLGEARDTLARDLYGRHMAGEEHEEEYHYYPREWREPYLSRRRGTGFALYDRLGIAKGDKEAMSRQLARNYLFFDAPVGMIFTLDRDLEVGSWLDLGTFLQTLMLAARGFDLHTCPQQAFAKFHRVIRDHLDIPESEVVVCGLALGHMDPDAPENNLITEREPLAAFTTFHGD